MRVELHDIHKIFGPVRANDGISLTFEPGKIYGLLGENGAGKSTLMKILSGYQQPTSGSISLNGKPAVFNTPSDALAAGVGMLYQDPQDFPPLTVVENHLLAYDEQLVLDFSGGQAGLKTYEGRYGFEVKPEAYVDGLTLGERQQLELMRLLALGAELLVLDEPTTGISAEQKEKLFGTMRRLARDEQKTIILVSHKLEEVQELCDAVAVLRSGKLVGTQELPCPTEDLVRLMFGEEIPRSERESREPGAVLLALEDVSVHTYRLNVEGVNLDLREGEVLGLAGLEGSGQRLLLQACGGLIPTAGGSLTFDGEPLKGRRSPFFWVPWLANAIFGLWVLLALVAISRGQIDGLRFAGQVVVAALVAGTVSLVGTILVAWTSVAAYHVFRERGGAYVPAGRLEEGLIAGLSLTEHQVLAAPSHSFAVNWTAARQIIAERIKLYNVVGRPDSEAQELSGGNQQRAMFALLNSPLRLLLMEHPTRGLDVTSANTIWGLFRQRGDEGTAIVFMSADLDELLERSDRIAVFSGGRLLRIVSAAETTVDALGHLIGGQNAE